MSKPELSAPPEVVSALETLERATTPVNLGPAYKTILDWRESSQRWTFGRRLYQIAMILIFFASLWLLNSIDLEISDYWRGAMFGATLVLLLTSIRDWSSRRSAVTMTFLERIDEAIDRWRHAVPAMKDFPK